MSDEIIAEGTVEVVGGCFCGAVRYRVAGGLANGRSCHCSRCRKAFSGAGSAYAEVAPGASFGWTQGADRVSAYATGNGFGLGFCGQCGTTLCGFVGTGAADKDVHGVTLGSVDGDPGVDIALHLFVGSKAPWDHVGGSAPQYLEHPPESVANSQ